MTVRTVKPPYLLRTRPDERDAAWVHDRATGLEIGYVLLWAKGWAAYLNQRRGQAISFGRQPWPAHVAHLMPEPDYDLRYTRYRADAARKVWDTWQAEVTVGCEP